MQDQERAALLPCPFCGGAAYMLTEHDADDVTWHFITCRGCGARTRGKWHSAGNDCPQLRAEIRDEWNRRASLPPTVAQVERKAQAATAAMNDESTGHASARSFPGADDLGVMNAPGGQKS